MRLPRNPREQVVVQDLIVGVVQSAKQCNVFPFGYQWFNNPPKLALFSMLGSAEKNCSEKAIVDNQDRSRTSWPICEGNVIWE